MAGQVYLTLRTVGDLGKAVGDLLNKKTSSPPIKTLENVENIAVATPFLIFNFTDGTTVMQRAEDFDSVQFTPYPAETQESDTGEGQSTDNSTD